ncbi:GFA family protein [Undibacterium flavidum]|uniref:GFA family protein n=1 Tax=Undibacterium flavidum TaxID=2762297 RepID=A0ABR6YF42_9BURK|nr:GFA family protein [Undibacterium flavidum]MBC3875190.1 GFA family protein [Undibacterium flavidum]
MKYQGSCHCGQIAFEVEGDLTNVMSCNCSLCQRKGALMWFVPTQAMTLLTPVEAMRTYTFNKHVIQHHFCPTCGIHPYGEAAAPDGQQMAAINVRCIDDLDLSSLTVQEFNGRER